MICARCDQPILPGQKSVPYDIPSPSGPGTTVYLHKELCVQVDAQRTQESIRH